MRILYNQRELIRGYIPGLALGSDALNVVLRGESMGHSTQGRACWISINSHFFSLPKRTRGILNPYSWYLNPCERSENARRFICLCVFSSLTQKSSSSEWRLLSYDQAVFLLWLFLWMALSSQNTDGSALVEVSSLCVSHSAIPFYCFESLFREEPDDTSLFKE